MEGQYPYHSMSNMRFVFTLRVEMWLHVFYTKLHRKRSEGYWIGQILEFPYTVKYALLHI